MVAAGDPLAAALAMEKRAAVLLKKNANSQKHRDRKKKEYEEAMIAGTGLPSKHKQRKRFREITMEAGLAAAAGGNADLSGWVKLEDKSETTGAFFPAKAKRIRRQLPSTAEACMAAVADGIVDMAGWVNMKTEKE